MNIKRAKDEIKNTVKAYLLKDEKGDYKIPAIRQRPVLLIGAPGIGKTQIMEQIARECRIGLVAYTITHHTRQSAVGLPFIQKEDFGGREYSVTEYTMSEIIASVYRTIKETGNQEGILFIDEINCVSETLAPTMLQFLQCKTFGNQAVPQGWIIVAAGNPPEYNKSVRDFDMVTLDRVRRMNVEPDYTVWKQYARQQHVHPALLGYLQLRSQNFYRVQTDVDGMQFVTARGWEDLSNLMDTYEELGLPVDVEVIQEFIQHEDIARDVSAYLDLYQKYQDDYGIQDILAGQVEPKLYERLLDASFDERLSVVNLLLSGLQQRFMMISAQKQMLDLWFSFLKQYKEQTDAEAGDYEGLLMQWRERMKQEALQGFVTRSDEQIHEQVCNKIEQNRPASLLGKGADAFDEAVMGFRQEQEELELAESQVSKCLEYAFDFMEAAFRQGQEMVLFINELTLGTDSAAFLADNACQRYLEYNQTLLVGNRKADLLSALAQDEIRGQEHSLEF